MLGKVEISFKIFSAYSTTVKKAIKIILLVKLQKVSMNQFN